MNQPECDNVSVFSWRAALFHASAWVSIQLSLSACVCARVCLLECVCLSTSCGRLMVLVLVVVCLTFPSRAQHHM